MQEKIVAPRETLLLSIKELADSSKKLKDQMLLLDLQSEIIKEKILREEGITHEKAQLFFNAETNLCKITWPDDDSNVTKINGGKKKKNVNGTRGKTGAKRKNN